MIGLDKLNVLDMYSLLVAIISTAFGLFAVILTYIGYYKFKQADKLVENKIKGKLKEFENTFEETLIDIQSVNAKINSSYQYFKTKDYDKVIEILNEAEKIYPKAYNLYNTMGYAYKQKKDFVSAELSFNKSIIYHPKRIEGYNDLANLYEELGNSKQAEEIKKRAFKKVPDAKDKWQEINNT